MLRVVGVCGCTCAGKTTVTRAVQRLLQQLDINTHYFNQDDYYKEPEHIEPLPDLDHYKYDHPEAIEWAAFVRDVQQRLDKLQVEPPHMESQSTEQQSTVPDVVVLIEGNMILLEPALNSLLQQRYFLQLEFAEAASRRAGRTDYEPPDTPGYFEQYVWPAYQQHRQEALEQPDVQLLDATADPQSTALRIAASVLKSLHADTWVQLQQRPLDLQLAVQYVTEPDCGAISTFIGCRQHISTTRDNFSGRRVVRLEYESYEPMARQQMRAVCQQARQRWPHIKRIALLHRLGVVDVCESSVIVSVGSPHRQDAQQAQAWIIDELKRTVPIWKKEIYDDAGSEWKANKESDWVAEKPVK